MGFFRKTSNTTMAASEAEKEASGSPRRADVDVDPEFGRDPLYGENPLADDIDDESSTRSLNGAHDVELAHKVWGPKSKIVLYVAIGLAAYAYSLDGTTTWQYLTWATSNYLEHSVSATIATANAIIISVGKPFMAKLADVIGRAQTFCIVLVLYAVGYIVVASAKNAGAIGGGQVVYSFGYTGLQLLSQIIIADITTLRWRGLVTGLLAAPFIINNFVAAEIAQGINPDWRWGYGMFAIIVPVCIIPIIIVLFWGQSRAKKLNPNPAPKDPWGRVIKRALIEMDFGGLILVTAALALLLIPLGQAAKASKGWQTPSMIVMITLGCVLFFVFFAYEYYVPPRPVFNIRWLRRPSILAAVLIGFLDFFSFYMQYTWLYSYMMVTEPGWSIRELTYYMATQTIALTVFAIAGGIWMFYTRRYKWMLVTGLLIRLLGLGIMLYARSDKGDVASLVMCQVLQGLGGGFASVSTQIGAQASVRHMDVATVTAMFLLLTEIGNAVGTAVANAIWSSGMPALLAEHVPTTNQTLLAELFGSITIISALPADDPIRMGAIDAYQVMMHKLVLGALIIAIFPPFVALFLAKNIKLTDAQNAYDGRDLEGKKIQERDAAVEGGIGLN